MWPKLSISTVLSISPLSPLPGQAVSAALACKLHSLLPRPGPLQVVITMMMIIIIAIS